MLYLIVESVVLLWGLILVIMANAEANKFSTAKSFLSIIVAVLALLVLVPGVLIPVSILIS